MVIIVVATFCKENFHIMIITKNPIHIVTRLCTTICKMVPTRLRGKQISKNSGEYTCNMSTVYLGCRRHISREAVWTMSQVPAV
jgi:hypothetical protein